MTQAIISYSYSTASIVSYITTTYTPSATTVTVDCSASAMSIMTITSTPAGYTPNVADSGSQSTAVGIVNPMCKDYVSETTAIGIGVGSGIAGIALAMLAAVLFFKRRQRRSRKHTSSYVVLTPSPGNFLSQRMADPYKVPQVTQVPVQQQQQQGYMQVPQYRQDPAGAARAVSPNNSHNSSNTAWSIQAPSWMHEADNTNPSRGGYDRRLWNC